MKHEPSKGRLPGVVHAMWLIRETVKWRLEPVLLRFSSYISLKLLTVSHYLSLKIILRVRAVHARPSRHV